MSLSESYKAKLREQIFSQKLRNYEGISIRVLIHKPRVSLHANTITIYGECRAALAPVQEMAGFDSVISDTFPPCFSLMGRPPFPNQGLTHISLPL